MKQGNAQVGFQVRQGPLQPVRQHFRVSDERLHLRLAEIAGMGSPKATPETLGARDPDPGAVDVQRYRLTFQYRHANAFEDPPDFLFAVGVVVVVAKHGNHRNWQAAQVVGQNPDLFRSTAARQLAGQQAGSGPGGEVQQARTAVVLGACAVVKIADGRDPYHATGASPSRSVPGSI